jgi:hypothetical protein
MSSGNLTTMSWTLITHAARKLPTRALRILELLLEADSEWARFGRSVALLSLRHMQQRVDFIAEE